MSPTVLVVLLAVGIPVFVGTILVLVFGLAAGAAKRTRAALEHEGIELESGPHWITTRYRDFRARGLYRGVGITKSRGSLVLTRQGRILVLPGFRGRYWLVPRDVTVGVDPDGALRIRSDRPSGEGASGSIDYRVALPDAGAWVSVLTKAGAGPLVP